MKSAYDIVLRPIITEQSMEHMDIKKCAFAVAKDANKIEIKKAVEEIFGVKVQKVTTINVRGKQKRQGAQPAGYTAGKQKRQGAQPAGYTAAWKKAVIRLTADSKTIEIFEGMV